MHVRDSSVVAEYHKIITGVLARYQGEVIVSKPTKETLEGDNPPDERVTVLKFPDEALARGYIGSTEYQAGKKARQSGATMVMRLLAE
jgi:uncharacterized protein (DUF1330 family)